MTNATLESLQSTYERQQESRQIRKQEEAKSNLGKGDRRSLSTREHSHWQKKTPKQTN